MRVIVLLLNLLLNNAIVGQQNCHDCGVAFMRTRVYKPELEMYVKPGHEKDIKYLFHDSMVIVEILALAMNKDAKNGETWRPYVYGYAFLDVRTKSFYRYRHFSDTARIIEATRHIEDGPEVDDWNYFIKPRIPHISVPLTDTVINGEKCHRLLGFFKEKGDTVLTETMYYINEEERPLISVGKTVVKGKHFSVIRFDDFDNVRKKRTYLSTDITSHNLTKEELKVFTAWKMNAKKHPVVK